jgi:hypothetical protein
VRAISISHLRNQEDVITTVESPVQCDAVQELLHGLDHENCIHEVLAADRWELSSWLKF